MALIKTDNKHYNAIADKIREHSMGDFKEATFLPEQMADGIEVVFLSGQREGYEAGYTEGYETGTAAGGGDNYYDTFWNAYQQNKYRTNYRRAFSGGGWTSEILKPKYSYQFPEGTTTDAYEVFSMCGIGNTEADGMVDVSYACAKLDFSKCKLVNNLFIDAFAKNITVDFSSAEQLANVFNVGNGGRLENIKLTVSEKCTYDKAFAWNGLLQNLEFAEGSVIGNTINFSSCGLFSVNSILSIFRALKKYASTDTGYLANTLTLHATAWNTINTAYPNGTDDMPLVDGETWKDYLTAIGWSY